MSKPNVFLISIDSLRADYVGAVTGGFASSPTPHLDALAREGTVFTNGFSQGPYTTISMPSLLTGRYGSRLKRSNFRDILLVEGASPFAEVFRAGGYSTAGVHSNPYLSRVFGFDSGFQFFYDDLLENPRLPWVINRLRRLLRVKPHLAADTLNGIVLNWLDSASEPVFVWLHYMDVHGPYSALGGSLLPGLVKKFRGELLWRKAITRPTQLSSRESKTLIEDYRKHVSYLDEELGRFLEALDRRRLLDNSLVVITADHGDEFFEHNSYSHSHKLYDELTHIPIIVSGSGVQPGRVDDLVSNVDLYPTILEMAGLPSPPGVEGVSLKGYLEGKREVLRPHIICEAEDGDGKSYMYGVRTHEWKLIHHDASGTVELYRLPEDPKETRNVAKEFPDVVAEYEKIVDAHRKGDSPVYAAPAAMSAEEQKMLEKRLEDLGYLD